MKKVMASIPLCFLCLLSVFAEQPQPSVRIDINDPTNTITFTNLSVPEGCRIDTYGWDRENAQHNLYTDLQIPPKTWTQVEVSFTPLSDGEVIVRLRGIFHRPDESSERNVPVFAYYDLFEVEGAKVMDGDFEKLDENGKLLYWTLGSSEPKAEIITDPQYVKSGKQSVKTWHDSPASQSIDVKANQPVKIKVWAYFE